jgi:hypothetical protein
MAKCSHCDAKYDSTTLAVPKMDCPTEMVWTPPLRRGGE